MKTPSILNGNDVRLRVPLERHYISDGELVKENLYLDKLAPIGSPALINISVFIVGENNTIIPVEFTCEASSIIVVIEGHATTCGYYGLEITGNYSSRSVRSYVNRYFRLVHEEEEADATPDSNGVYNMQQAMVIR